MSILRTIPLRSWLLVCLSAFLQVLIFPTGAPSHWLVHELGWVALTPFLYAVLYAERSHSLNFAASAALGYVCGILWYLGNCAWIYQTMYLYGGLPKPVALLILLLFALYLGLYHALFASALALVQKSRMGLKGALWLAPFLWVGVELARARITGFPWDLLGNSQVDNLLLTRLAPLGGVMAMSFVIVAINAGFAAYLLMTGTKRVWIAAATLVAAMLLQFGAFLSQQTLPIGNEVAISMQENLAVGATGREIKPLTMQQELTEFSAMSLQPHTSTPAAAQAPVLLIWPEAPAHLRSDEPQFRESLGQLASTIHAPAIIGSLGVDFTSDAPRGYYLYDSASLFDATGTYEGRYDKIHLVPWGEYIPFKSFFAFAHKLTEGAGDMDPGTQRRVFTTSGHSYGVFVCYESIFGDEVREFAKNGAEVLVNISDDGWYGDTGAPWQHLNMARMRAIENHRWLLRSTNTGVTTAIDPYGRLVGEAPRHVRAAFTLPFRFEQGTTFYTRHGDWFAWLCVVISLAGVSAGLLNLLK